MSEHVPTVISLFSGCGGSSLGYSQAGFRELLAVEWDPHACEIFRLNFPDVPLWEGDITALTGERALMMAGIVPGELDVLDGSPPCQGFSITGKRRFTDDRNFLFKEYIRLLAVMCPKMFILENVPGMIRGKMRLLASEVLSELSSLGYKVIGKILNAADYGVPQSRRRLIVIGIRCDMGDHPGHPVRIRELVTIREAWSFTFPQGPIAPGLTGKAGWIARQMKPGQQGSDVTGKGWFSIKRLSWDKPSLTLTKMGSYMGAPLIIHPDEDRGLSIGEAKRLQGFPDNFKLMGTWEQQWARIGNSVPPPLIRAVAAHLRKEVLRKCEEA